MPDPSLFGLIHPGYAPVLGQDRKFCCIQLTLIPPADVNRAVWSALVSARLFEA